VIVVLIITKPQVDQIIQVDLLKSLQSGKPQVFN
jgi:hypothetical protein